MFANCKKTNQLQNILTFFSHVNTALHVTFVVRPY